MVYSGNAAGNGLLHKQSWCHSDEGGQSPEGRGCGAREKVEKQVTYTTTLIISLKVDTARFIVVRQAANPNYQRFTSFYVH